MQQQYGAAQKQGRRASLWRWLRRQGDRRVWEARAAADPTGFLTDGFIRPSIGVVGGWILGGLLTLVLWLTLEWAPNAAERARKSPDALGDAITPEGGWAAIIIIAMLALAAGWEQTIEAWLDGARRTRAALRAQQSRRARRRSETMSIARLVLGGAFRVVWTALKFLGRIPSRVLSVVDWLLAKVFASLAGAHRIGYGPRYLVLFLWIAAAFLAGLRLTPGSTLQQQLGLPDQTALILICLVMVMIIGVARRWAWVEQDRDAFLITRTEEPRPSGVVGDDAPAPVRRIGFREDLRDEALTGLVSLFALIPLALMHIELLTPNTFAIEDAPNRPLSLIGYQLSENWTLDGVFGKVARDNPLSWYSYFGAELAKSVPFVDWSEVFHVPNGTPISPATPAGASVVFGLRAGLDLLVLAAVLQAISIAGRTRQVRAAFAGRLIDVLDPFDERLYFRRAESRRVFSPGAREIDQPGVLEFTLFDRARILKRASGRDESARPGRRSRAAQRAMMTVAARQIGSALQAGAMQDPLNLRRTDQTLPTAVEAIAERLERAKNTKLQRHALELFGELGLLTEAQRRRLGAAALHSLMDRKRRESVRAMAALELGRLGQAEAVDALAAIAFAEDATLLGAASVVALAKLNDGRAVQMAEAFPDAGLLGAMRAHALDLIDGGDRLPVPKIRRIPAGDFLMGAPSDNASAERDDQPQHSRRVAAFALAETPTTDAAFAAYRRAADAPAPEGAGDGERPAINISWLDAQAYALWLRTVTGDRWRLPSEAEWEYACRAGSPAAYSFGDDSAALAEHGWFAQNSGGRAHAVARKAANPFGLYDMHGNVWEWCQDQWRDSYHGAPTDCSARISSADTALRRGGSWFDQAESCRSAERFWARRGHRNVTTGVRLACAVIA
ncbi:MAG: SUMF1/EgtB/PvdO family nonheme iron enzyme [Neomegalonema sp.]|nr:SUMF1/EgtB/PvdO family nonheme iron enzyme [Neomegalonema sp.]